MTAYDKGFNDGKLNKRNDRHRTYQGNASEHSYWSGYVMGFAQVNPDKRIVQCEREGKIFACDNINDCTCPVCGRRYINGESDRPLTILK